MNHGSGSVEREHPDRVLGSGEVRASVEFRLLGPFEAWRDDVRVDLGDLQQRHVLAVLVLHANKPVSVERLTDIIWGEQRPKTNLVTGYIAKIRRALREAGADAGVHTTASGYLLEVDERAIDTVRFAALCDDAATARRDGDQARATSLLHEAVALWRGPYLEDLDIDRVGGSAVMVPDDSLLDALGDLAELELANGNYRWVRNQLRQPVNADPSHQRLATLLMRGLLANGDRVQALDVYHKTKTALDTYSVAVADDLRQLSQLAHYGEPRTTLPPRPTRFVGRDVELAELEAAVERGDGVVWISGMPGVGKSALALEAAYRTGNHFCDARLFVALNGFAPGVTPTEPADALARALLDLGVPAEHIPSTLGGRIALFQNAVAGTRTLVVLDNAHSEEQVRPLLVDAPGCLTIVTSRRAGDLGTGRGIRIAPLEPQDATRLFTDLSGEARTEGHQTQVAEVVTRCGFLPLQIRVTAAQFRRHHTWSVDYLLDVLQDSAPWTTDHGSQLTAYSASYLQLNDSQQALFRLFGLLPGDDLDAAGAAALIGQDVPAARNLLDDLHAGCLIEESAPGRYHMLKPIKDFAGATLSRAPQEGGHAMLRRLRIWSEQHGCARSPDRGRRGPWCTLRAR